jgi:hypothetical protein
MSKKKKFTYRIKDVEWHFFCLPQSSYARSHGKDSDAITYPHDKEVYFNRARFLPGAIRHEIFHVYVASSGINSANLTVDQMEELGAEIYEQHGPEMDVLVDKLLDFFMR